jgi:hypothetical protein
MVIRERCPKPIPTRFPQKHQHTRITALPGACNVNTSHTANFQNIIIINCIDPNHQVRVKARVRVGKLQFKHATVKN